MATPEPQRDQRMMQLGSRLLLLGLVLAVVGLAIAIPLDGTAAGIGVALASLGCVPTVAGLALVGSALVSRRSRAGRPFA
jgi:uncharacterized membrane protein